MKRKRYCDEQIISIPKEHEADMKVQDPVRKHAGSIILAAPCKALALHYSTWRLYKS